MPATKCLVCNRTLKNPKSIEIGKGKICAAKTGTKGISSEQYDLFDFSKNSVSPIKNFTDDIVLSRRADGTAHANIAQRIRYHSPSGFEWGYSGSGPADLALNILSIFVPQNEAYSLHQSFKRDFIAPMSKEGGVIKNNDIKEWIQNHIN